MLSWPYEFWWDQWGHIICQWWLCCAGNQVDCSTPGLTVTGVIHRQCDGPKDNGSAATAQCSLFLKWKNSPSEIGKAQWLDSMSVGILFSLNSEIILKENNKVCGMASHFYLPMLCPIFFSVIWQIKKYCLDSRMDQINCTGYKEME